MKLGNPFGKGNLCYLTQTYHGSSNTAIDCYGTKYIANLPVYAIADGKVGNYYKAGGSYISQYPDNSDLRIWYVHIYNCVANGSYVKKGQKIGEIAPKSVNGGYPEHLHLGLTPKGKYIMDYFDRSIPFRTRYTDIKASWFKSDGLLNWPKFKDLSYTNNTMAFKKGDKIIFTGEQNIRKGSGTSYPVTISAKVGMVATIKDNPRVADNYTWYDMDFGGGSGWVADVGKFKIYVAPIIPEPPVAPDCKKYIEQIDTLNKEIEGLKMGLGSLEELLEDKDKQLGIISNELRLANERIELLEENIESMSAELEDRKEYVKVLEKNLSLAEDKVELLEENIKNCEETEKQLEGELKKAQEEARVSIEAKLKCQEEYDKLKLKCEEGSNLFKKVVEWIVKLFKKE